jgi:hypothetical protein
MDSETVFPTSKTFEEVKQGLVDLIEKRMRKAKTDSQRLALEKIKKEVLNLKDGH